MSDLARAQGVRDVVTRIAHTIDFRGWSDLRALYADQVRTDYTSLFGGEVQQQRADDLVEGWRLLSPLHATQHLLGPIAVQLKGGTAIAECHVRGYHVMRGAAGSDELMVAGQWLIELSQRGYEWAHHVDDLEDALPVRKRGNPAPGHPGTRPAAVIPKDSGPETGHRHRTVVLKNDWSVRPVVRSP